MEQSIWAEVYRRKNPHKPLSNNLNVHRQGRMPTVNFTDRRNVARRLSRAEESNWSNKILRKRKANVAAVIKLDIEKKNLGSGLQISEEEEMSEWKVSTRKINPGIEINDKEVVTEGKIIW